MNTDGKNFTWEEYENIISANQTDKDKKLVNAEKDECGNWTYYNYDAKGNVKKKVQCISEGRIYLENSANVLANDEEYAVTEYEYYLENEHKINGLVKTVGDNKEAFNGLVVTVGENKTAFNGLGTTNDFNGKFINKFEIV